MVLALVILFGVPLLLLLAGVIIAARAVRSLRRGETVPAAGILRIVAGAGSIVGCLFAVVLGLVGNVQYGIVILPMAALFGALIWGGGFLIAAGIIEWSVRRRNPVSGNRATQ